MPSDTDVLIEMGFDSERVKVAVTKSGGCKLTALRGHYLLLLNPPWNEAYLPITNFARHLVQGALEWLEQNQDKSLEEIKNDSAQQQEGGEDPDEPPALKPGEEARSLVCNECGKKFRSQGQAEFHASKTEHVDFSESTEEIAPLTEEEKAAKLVELRERLAEKRAKASEQDKLDKKRNDVSIYVCEGIDVIKAFDSLTGYDICDSTRKSNARAPKRHKI